tara:strand:- start:76 stop:372 length:297 start_codon:yes stop_codon:yes gene_type:complete
MLDNTLHTRLEALENEVRELKMGKTRKEESSEKKGKEKKEKKPREPTKYNIFVSEYINEQKEKLGKDFNHKIAFKNAAGKWNETKETKETNETTETKE